MEKSRSDLMQTADLREKSARLELHLEQAKAAGAAATASSAAHHTATLDTPRTTPGDLTALPNVSNVTVGAFQPARPVGTVTTAVVPNLFSSAVATANSACTADELISGQPIFQNVFNSGVTQTVPNPHFRFHLKQKTFLHILDKFHMVRFKNLILGNF